MNWVSHFCYFCKLKFAKAKDYIIHYNECHKNLDDVVDSRKVDVNT